MGIISGFYTPANPEKYIGSKEPFYRSSWELVFCRLCDNNASILQWAIEPVEILYKNPLKENKYSKYWPDFFIVYIDRNGKKHAELIEIKPAKESSLQETKSKRDALRTIVNAAKWNAATEWCKKRNITFRILTEDQIFNRTRKTKK